ncbi:hypothetical protein EVAR_32505_1 [Eumeta japonica]|uniref:Uncharacterized protein n=1 Tax=Eumeta variegata TaxID=151549 RepID=A0A4C1W6I3_EUMVA|nr:hypothetical protein EVAR_32505_1 [Eumeta japonica]
MNKDTTHGRRCGKWINNEQVRCVRWLRKNDFVEVVDRARRGLDRQYGKTLELSDYQLYFLSNMARCTAGKKTCLPIKVGNAPALPQGLPM